jgi:plasmid rolling circle replication initiator protein Rep
LTIQKLSNNRPLPTRKKGLPGHAKGGRKSASALILILYEYLHPPHTLEKCDNYSHKGLNKAPESGTIASANKLQYQTEGLNLMSNNSINLGKMQEKHEKTMLLAASYYRIGDKRKALRTLECGTYLGFAEIPGEGMRLVEANFCDGRLCPTCNWRRSLRIYSTTSQIMDCLDRTYGKKIKYLFLTLTVKNIPGDKLSETIDTMADAYKRMTNNRAWKRRVKGAMRTLEVTVNHETQEYHPHYHLILVVDGKYATKNDETYWTHADWQHAWQQAARLDYKPDVSIERVKGRRKGIAEISKYVAKDADYILPDNETETDRIVTDLDKHLYKRRLISYTGLMREARISLGIGDPERAPLTDEVRGDIANAIQRYHWSAGLGCYVPGPPKDER